MRESGSSFLTAHGHILGYLVPYHGVVDLDKRVKIGSRLFSYNKTWMKNTTVKGKGV